MESCIISEQCQYGLSAPDTLLMTEKATNLKSYSKESQKGTKQTKKLLKIASVLMYKF